MTSAAATFSRALRVSNELVGRPAGEWLGGHLGLLSNPTTPIETAAILDSFLPSLMPRNSALQGLAAGMNVLTVRALAGVVEAANTRVLGSEAHIVARLGLRGVEFAAGQSLAMVPEEADETLWRAGARSGGALLRAAAIGGAVYDLGQPLRARSGAASRMRPMAIGALVSSGLLVWASRRLAVRRREIQRWPVVQEAHTVGAVGVAAGVAVAGTSIARAYEFTGRGLHAYLGSGGSKRLLAGSANACLWVAGVSALYNAAIASIGQANEKIEPAYSLPPSSNLVSGGPESRSPFGELGQQGRRYVSDVVPPELIMRHSYCLSPNDRLISLSCESHHGN